MHNMPLISIIVPVYKVEKYLRECVDSIINQTYTNLEIILVDDGSPDNCPQICDEYASKDNRVVVIHKENGGQSDARNVGIERAGGDYLNFIDSDDWVAPDIIELLYTNLITHDVDISCCGYFRSFVDLNVPYTKGNPDRPLLLTNAEAATLAINGKISYSAMHKLYKKYIFDNIRYPLVRGEDYLVIIDVFMAAEKVFYDPIPKYFYRQRMSGFCHDYDIENRRARGIRLHEQRQASVERDYPNLAPIGQIALYRGYLGFIDKALLNKHYIKTAEGRAVLLSVSERVDERIMEIIDNTGLTTKEKYLLLALSSGISMYRLSRFLLNIKKSIMRFYENNKKPPAMQKVLFE